MKKIKFGALCLGLLLQACQSSKPYTKTVDSVVFEKYLGKWYVIANRPTMFEKEAYNATETYSLNKETGKVDVDFTYKKGGFDGPEKSMPQTAWIHDKNTNAHWKISLWWLPFDLDYLIIDLDTDYQWTVVGVPNQKYLWVMSRKPEMDDALLSKILTEVKNKGYDISEVNRVPQKW
jgi:apolipoprotein D and lipocalin family protein